MGRSVRVGRRRRKALDPEVGHQLRLAVLKNAESLLGDAQYLYRGDRFARSCALGIAAGEEFGKWKFTFRRCLEAAAGEPVDWGEFWSEWNKHPYKEELFTKGDIVQQFLGRHPEWFEAVDDRWKQWLRDAPNRNQKAV